MNTVANILVFAVAMAFAAGIWAILRQSGQCSESELREMREMELARLKLIEKEQEAERNGEL